jgi:hypothetical protein
MSPFKSDDLTHIIEQNGNTYVVFWSPETAEDEPEYCELGSFPTKEQAQAWLARDNGAS